MNIIKRTVVRILCSGVVPALLLAGPGPAGAAVLVVDNTADSGVGSLRQALAAAATGDTITFAPALSGQTILLTSGELVVSGNLTVDGSALVPGIGIDGNAQDRVFYIAPGAAAVLISLTITNGYSRWDNAVHPGYGGGIFNDGSLTLNNCTVVGNTAAGECGGVQNNGTAALNQCTLTANTSPDKGAALRNEGEITLNHCTIARNSGIAAAIHNLVGGGSSDASVTLINSIVSDNPGGDIYNLHLFNYEDANIVQSFAGDPATGPAPLTVSARLAPLGDYGGPTQTLLPLPGSPAIDAAVDSNFSADQRGVSRPVDGDANGSAAADLGAVEFHITRPVAGAYNGLFYEAAGVSPQSSGGGSAQITAAGKVTAKVALNGKTYSLTGLFDAVGRTSNSIPRKGMSPLTIRLYSLLSNEIYGQITDGTWTADFFADRAVFNARTNPAQFAAKYTWALPGGLDAAVSPFGDSFGAVTVDAGGGVTLQGSLADGTALSQKSVVSAKGRWPLQAYVSSTKASVVGWVSFAGGNPKSYGGDLVWTKPGNPAAKIYPAGFTNSSPIFGAQYTPPAAGTPVLSFPAAEAVFNGTSLNGTVVTFSLSNANKVTNPSDSKFSLSITPSTGLFSGRVTDPVTLKPVTFKGAILQSYSAGYGFFMNPNQSGEIAIGPQ